MICVKYSEEKNMEDNIIMSTEVKKVVGYFRVSRKEDAVPSVEELLRDMRRERAKEDVIAVFGEYGIDNI